MTHVTSFRLPVWLRLAGLALMLGLCLLTGGTLTARTAHAQRASTLRIANCNEASLDLGIANAASGDTVTFGCSGDIQLTQTLIISKNLTLNGSGQTVTLDGQNNVQVFIVNSSVNFMMNALTVAHGHAGALGGGLDNTGGTVSISNSTFSNNSAAYDGGGLVNYSGTLSISNSTFSNNSATYDGGGLAIYNGTVTINNSTFANNSAHHVGGGLFNDGTMTISNSTFSTNSASNVGGGLDNEGTLNVSGSIMANNTPSNCAGNLTDGGYNLESTTDCGFTSTGSVQKTDPKFDPNGLADNGGPTQTLALQPSSPAIDKIPAANCPATDGRGMTRPDDSETSCDIGAYESNFPPDTDLALTNVPANITTNATSAQGAVVTYTAPTATDEGGETPTVSCTPASGSTFAIGTTTVTCTASDSDDTPSTVNASFTVTVVDKLPPSLQLPASPLTVDATSPQGAVVNYTVTASDPVYPANQLTISCTPASASTFAIGSATVNCTVSDPAGNSASGSFTVTVNGAATQISSLLTLVNSFHLQRGIQTSLDLELQVAQTALAHHAPKVACAALKLFRFEVAKLTGHGITTSQATQLLASSKGIQGVIGC